MQPRRKAGLLYCKENISFAILKTVFLFFAMHERFKIWILLAMKILLFLALLTPLVLGLKTFIFPFVAPKIFYFRILVEIAFALFLVLLWHDRSYLPKKTWTLLATGVFLGAAFLSALFGVDWQMSWWGNFERMEGLFTIVHGFVFFILLGVVFRAKKDWMNLLGAFLGISVLLIFSGILQRFASADDPFLTLGGVTRVYGTLGNYIYFGHYALFSFWFSVFVFFETAEKKGKWFSIFVMILSVIGLFLSASRGPLLAWMVSLVVFGIGSLFVVYTRWYRIAFIGVSGVALAVLLLAIFSSNSFIRSVPGLGGLHEIASMSGTASTRLMAWDIAWKGFLDRPVFGWGWGNYYVVFNRWYHPAFLEFGWQETWFDHAHNQYVDMLATTGIVGFVGYLSIFVVLFAMLFAVIRTRQKEGRVSFFVLVSLLVAHGVNNIFVFEHPSSYVLFFLLIALVTFFFYDSRGVIAPSQTQKNTMLPAWGKVIIVVLFLFVLHGLYYGNIRGIERNMRDRELQVSFRSDPKETMDKMVTEASLVHPYQRDLRNDFAQTMTILERPSPGTTQAKAFIDVAYSAIGMLEDNAREFPYDARRLIALVQAYKDILLLGENVSPRMHEIFRTLEELSPKRQQVYYYWAELYVVEKNYEEAVRLVKKTIADDENVFYGYWLLAKIEASRGAWADAHAYLDEAEEHGFRPDPDTEAIVNIIREQYAKENG
ncbi:MAG TPA: hypothetical protein DCY48_04710 [Candidatus Magasanikbacteria bacterium]|nr:hypothetical protein [Candidatus Magasanikbacteria bacterium]